MPRVISRSSASGAWACRADRSSACALPGPLYREPRLLVFDEATSALDSQSESEIIANHERHPEKGRTAVVIAHRLSTIMRADKILVLY